MRNKLIELFTLYLLFPFLFSINVLQFENRFYYFGFLFLYILIQSIRIKDQLRFQLKKELKMSLINGIKLSIFAIVLIYPINLFMDIRPFQSSKLDIILFIFVYYPLISVPLQEFFYRKYYYTKFKGINKSILFWINVLSFSYIHYMYGGYLAVYLSFVSGLVINLNYKRYQNDLTIVIIHAFHGMIIFLLGYIQYFTDLFR